MLRESGAERLGEAFWRGLFPHLAVCGPVYWRCAEDWDCRVEGLAAERKDHLRVKLPRHGEFDAALVGHLPDGRHLVLMQVDGELRGLGGDEMRVSAKRSTAEGRRQLLDEEANNAFVKAAEQQERDLQGRHRCSHCGRRGHKKTTCGDQFRSKEEIERVDDAERARLRSIGQFCDNYGHPEDECPLHAWSHDMSIAPTAWQERRAELTDVSPAPRKRKRAAGKSAKSEKAAGKKKVAPASSSAAKIPKEASGMIAALKGRERKLFAQELLVLTGRCIDDLYELQALVQKGTSSMRFDGLDDIKSSGSEPDEGSGGE